MNEFENFIDYLILHLSKAYNLPINLNVLTYCPLVNLTLQRGGYENPAIHRLSVRLCNKPHKIGRLPWRLSNPPAVSWQFLLGWGIRRCCQPCSLNCPESLHLTHSSQLSFLAISHQDTWQCPHSLNCNFSLFSMPPSSPVSNKRPPFMMVSGDSTLSYVADVTDFFSPVQEESLSNQITSLGLTLSRTVGLSLPASDVFIRAA